MSKVSKDSVNYRPATNNKRCGNCEMFSVRKDYAYPSRADHGICTLVEGLIRRGDTCDKWQAKK